MLVIDKLDVAYGQSRVIHSLDLAVSDDETVAIMGRNSMGKRPYSRH